MAPNVCPPWGQKPCLPPLRLPLTAVNPFTRVSGLTMGFGSEIPGHLFVLLPACPSSYLYCRRWLTQWCSSWNRCLWMSHLQNSICQRMCPQRGRVWNTSLWTCGKDNVPEWRILGKEHLWPKWNTQKDKNKNSMAKALEHYFKPDYSPSLSCLSITDNRTQGHARQHLVQVCVEDSAPMA